MGNRSNNRVGERDETLLQSNGRDPNYINDSIISLLVNNEHMQVKKIFAVKNPVYLKRDTLTLERDSSNRHIYYISFSYDAAVPFDINIYLNASKITENEIKSKEKKPLISEDNEHKAINIHQKEFINEEILKKFYHYKPSKNFLNKKISIKNCPHGQNIKFFDNSAVIDIIHYTENKMDIEDSYDMIIEFVPIFEEELNEGKKSNEILFYTFCKLSNEENNLSSSNSSNNLIPSESVSIPFNNNNNSNNSSMCKIKVECQKLRTQNIWLDIHEVFNSALEGGECLICCHNIRNTLFLPCKHSCTCQNCAHSLRMRNNPCPICKNSIDDLVIIDVEKSNDVSL